MCRVIWCKCKLEEKARSSNLRKRGNAVVCWMHVLLIRVHRNWKLAKSLIGCDLAPTQDMAVRVSQTGVASLSDAIPHSA